MTRVATWAESHVQQTKAMFIRDKPCSPEEGQRMTIPGRVADFARRAYVRATVQVKDDRGDVPGWVLVSVMSAGLVTALWVVADQQLTSVLSRAIDSVTTP